ncbi:MAG: hypothetical protein AAF202_03360, partial [Pseudomonadota bacterium]
SPDFQYSEGSLPKLAIPLLTPLDWINSVVKGEPRQIDVKMVRDLWALDQRIDTGKAKQNLNFQPRSNQDSLLDTVTWIQNNFLETTTL